MSAMFRYFGLIYRIEIMRFIMVFLRFISELDCDEDTEVSNKIIFYSLNTLKNELHVHTKKQC